MKIYLKGKNVRDYAMFVLVINIALHISDLLQLNWVDVLKSKTQFKDIYLVEGKTKKKRKIKLNKTRRKALKEHMYSLETFDMKDSLFSSREGNHNPISRQRALTILKDAAKAVGIKDNVGTHTLRKPWDFHA